MKEKKKSDVSVLLGYVGKYKVLTYIGMFLSAVAMIMGMLPYVCIWLALLITRVPVLSSFSTIH